jgi:glycosyltransferase involved in cell wall biosynthesis
MVSVCMATKNGSEFIREQIDSVLPQLSRHDELIVSDDCSDDHTTQIVSSYADKRIKLFRNNDEKGVTKNFEAGLKRCAGDYIFLADQDDVWKPEKIKIMLEHLQHHDLVICDCDVADHTLGVKHRSFFNLNNSGSGLIKNIIRNSYMGCCMAFKRSVLNRALPFPGDIPLHDMWIGLIGEMHFKTHFIPQPLVYHRRHARNASTTSGSSPASMPEKIYNRYRIIRNLIVHKPYGE